MAANFIVQGAGFRLRPVGLDDADFIVQLRTSSPDRVRFLHPVSSDPERQRVWIQAYLNREHDYYWVIEQCGNQIKEGLIGLYNFDAGSLSAEWGRWILRPNSLAAVESALLVYRTAFERLNLHEIYCLTTAANSHVLSFHDSCGLTRSGILPNQFRLGDVSHDAIKHACAQANWPAVRNALEPQAERIARRLNIRPS